MEHETRLLVADAELRVEPTEDGKARKIVGYAARFNRYSEDLGGFREIIRESAFDHALASEADVRALINHDPNLILGRSKSGTLKLSKNAQGLKYEITPPDTQAARDLMASIERGDVDGSSFAFRVRGKGEARGERWLEEGEKVTRELTDVDLYDVSAVTFPAYPSTDVALRSLRQHQQAKPPEAPPLSVRQRQVGLAEKD